MKLDVPIKDGLRDEVSAASVARMWSRIEARGRARTRRSPGRAWALIGAGMACAAVVIVIAWPTTREPARGPIALASGATWGIEQARGELDLALSDRSRITLAAGSMLEPLSNSEHEVVLKQGRGDITYDIAPHGPRRWTIECGAVSVEIVGTKFRIDRNEQRVHVEVIRGIVLVRGPKVPDHVVRLTAGMHVDVPADDVATARPASATAPDARGSDTGDSPASPKDPRRSETWRDLAAHGAVAAAYAQLGHGGVAVAAASASVDDLFTLADVARLSGHPGEAVDPLERIVAAHAADPRAPLAALTLGRIQLRSLDQPARAAHALQRADALGLPAGVAEDAGALLVEALARAGDAPAARRAYEQFVARFSDSARTSELQQWIRDP